MSIKLNHIIVHSRDKAVSAVFLTEISGLPAPVPFYHFLTVLLDNEVTLDFIETDEDFDRQRGGYKTTAVKIRKAAIGQIGCADRKTVRVKASV